jgi:hypothetical protein
MVAVWHRGVAAAVLVLVFVALAGRVLRYLAFGPLPLILTVQVTVVRVVEVVTVLEGYMSTALAVDVAVVAVDLRSGTHRVLRDAGAGCAWRRFDEMGAVIAGVV